MGYDRPAGSFLRSIPEQALHKLDNETSLQYVGRLTQTVHHSTYHCEPQEFEPSWLIKILFSSPRLATFSSNGILVQRYFQCGFCHQRAYLLYRILRENGIAAQVQALDGHVVTGITVDGQPYLTDPDYGIGPFLWGDNSEFLRMTIVANYAASPVGDLDTLIRIFTDTSTDETYEDFLDKVHDRQLEMLDSAQFTAWLLLLFGIAVICLPGVLYRISR